VGWKHLADDVKLHGAENAMTALVWRLGQCEDPDDYYSSVPYEKVSENRSYLACRGYMEYFVQCVSGSVWATMKIDQIIEFLL
jgi:hypothetical protein